MTRFGNLCSCTRLLLEDSDSVQGNFHTGKPLWQCWKRALKWWFHSGNLPKDFKREKWNRAETHKKWIFTMSLDATILPHQNVSAPPSRKTGSVRCPIDVIHMTSLSLQAVLWVQISEQLQVCYPLSSDPTRAASAGKRCNHHCHMIRILWNWATLYFLII